MRREKRQGVLRVLSLIVCVAVLCCARVAAAQEVAVARNGGMPSVWTNYKVGIQVDVTNDADGWEDASITVSTIYQNARLTEVQHQKEYFTGLASDFDTKASSYYEVHCDFPEYVEIYTNFGGGMTSRGFEADVTVYINDVNVATKHIMAESGIWSEADTTNRIDIDRADFPYLDQLYIDASERVWSEGSMAEASVAVLGVDQYGTAWAGNTRTVASWEKANMTLTDSLGTTWGIDPRGGLYYYDQTYTVRYRGPQDARVTYTLRAPSENSINPVSTASFDISYEFVRKVEIRYDGKVVATHTGAADEELRLDFPDLVKPGFGLEWTLEGGGVLVPNGEDGPKYVFGATDGVLTAQSLPYNYRLVFDGNGSTGGKLGARIVRMGTRFNLPQNMYSRTGYEFAGWNTQPDGSGDSYENKASVQDLSTEKDAVVTLYAQWSKRTYTVTFVNRITNERTTQTVAYGEAATEPDAPAAVCIDAKYHNVFVKWSRDFSNIKGNITVSSVHKKEPHSFAKGEDGTTRCTVCGMLEGASSTATASVFGGGSVAVIAVGVVVAACAVVGAVVAKRRKAA